MMDAPDNDTPKASVNPSWEANSNEPRTLREYPDQTRVFVEACASVEATFFYLTFRPIEPCDSDAGMAIKTIGGGYHNVNVVREKVQSWLKRGAQEQRSVILRPCADVLRIENQIKNGKPSQKAIKMPFSDLRGVVFFQLDDIGDRDQDGNHIPHSDERTKAIVERLRPATAFTVQTSPKSLQLWIAIRKSEFTSNKDRKTFRARLVAGCNAEAPASGATRIPGSINFKEKYAEDHCEDYGIEYPVVHLGYASPGTIASRSMLESLGILAAPEKQASHEATIPRAERSAHAQADHTPRGPWNGKDTGGYPSYEIALKTAPRRSDGSPDGSKADISWAWRAINRAKWSIDEAIAYLMQESVRAEEWLSTRDAQAWERECRRTVEATRNGGRTA